MAKRLDQLFTVPIQPGDTLESYRDRWLRERMASRAETSQAPLEAIGSALDTARERSVSQRLREVGQGIEGDDFTPSRTPSIQDAMRANPLVAQRMAEYPDKLTREFESDIAPRIMEIATKQAADETRGERDELHKIAREVVKPKKGELWLDYEERYSRVMVEALKQAGLPHEGLSLDDLRPMQGTMRALGNSGIRLGQTTGQMLASSLKMANEIVRDGSDALRGGLAALAGVPEVADQVRPFANMAFDDIREGIHNMPWIGTKELQQISDPALGFAAAEPRIPTTAGEIFSSPGNFGLWARNEALPVLGTIGKIGVSSWLGGPAGGLAAAYGISSQYGYEEQAQAIQQQLMDQGVPEAQARREAYREATYERLLAGVPMAALNYMPFPLARAAGQLGRGPVSRLAARAGTASVTEGVTEALQSGTDAAVQHLYGPTQPQETLGDIGQQMLTEGAIGAIMGPLGVTPFAKGAGGGDARGSQPSPASPQPSTPSRPPQPVPEPEAPATPPATPEAAQTAPAAPSEATGGTVVERAVAAFTDAQRRVADRVEGQEGFTPEQQAEASRVAERARQFAGDAQAVPYESLTTEQRAAVDFGLELGVQTIVVQSPSGAEPVASGMMVEPGLVIVAPGQSPALGLVMHEALHGLAENAQSRRAWQQLHDNIQNRHLPEYQAAAERYRQRLEAAGMRGPTDAFRFQQEVISLMAERNADMIARAMSEPAVVQRMADAAPNFMRRWLDRIIGAARKVGFQPLAKMQTWAERDAGQKTNAQLALDFAAGLNAMRGPARAMVDPRPQPQAQPQQAAPQPTVQPVAMTEQAAQQQRAEPEARPEPTRVDTTVQPTGVAPRPQVRAPSQSTVQQLLGISQVRPNTPDSYVQAKKTPDGKWKLFWIGTSNEVFPGEVFNTRSEARSTFKAVRAYASMDEIYNPKNLSSVAPEPRARIEAPFRESDVAPREGTEFVSQHKVRGKGETAKQAATYEIRRDSDGNLNAYQKTEVIPTVGVPGGTEFFPVGRADMSGDGPVAVSARNDAVRNILDRAVQKLTGSEQAAAPQAQAQDGVLYPAPHGTYGESDATARRQDLMNRPFNDVRSIAKQMGLQASSLSKRQMVDNIIAKHDPEGDGAAIPAPEARVTKKKAKKKDRDFRDPKQRGFEAEDIGIRGMVEPQRKAKGKRRRLDPVTNREPSTTAAIMESIEKKRESEVQLDADRYMMPSRWGEEIDAAAEAYGYEFVRSELAADIRLEDVRGQGTPQTELMPHWVKSEKQLPTLYREHLQDNPYYNRIKSNFYDPEKGWMVPQQDYLAAVYGSTDAYAAFLDDNLFMQSGESVIDPLKLEWLRSMRDGGLDPDTQMLLYWIGKMEYEHTKGYLGERGRTVYRAPQPGVMELVDPFALRMGTRFRIGTTEWAVVRGPDGDKWMVGDGLAYPAEAVKMGVPVTRGSVRGRAAAKWEDMHNPADHLTDGPVIDDIPFALNESVLTNLVRGENVKSVGVKVGESAISSGVRAAPAFVRSVHYFAGDKTIGVIRDVYRDVYNNQSKGIQRQMMKPDRFDQFTDQQLRMFTNLPIPASELNRLSRTMARATARSKMGRPELSSPGMTPESEVLAKGFDAIMVKAMVNPDLVPDAEVFSRAKEMSAKPGEEARLVEKVGRGEIMDVFEAATAKMLYDKYAARYAELSSDEMTKMMALHQAWRYTGADTARAFRIRQQMRERSPESVALDLAMDILAQPVYGEVRRIRLNRAKLAKSTITAEDKAKAHREIRRDMDRAYERFHTRTAPFLNKELARRGLPPIDKMSLADFNTVKVRDAIADAMAYGKMWTASNAIEVTQGFRVAAMLSAPVTWMRNIVGSVGMAANRFAQKAIVGAVNDVFLRDPELPSMAEVAMGLNPVTFAKVLGEAIADGALYFKYPVRKHVPFGGELGVRDQVVTRREFPGTTAKVAKFLPNFVPAGDQVFNTFIVKMEARAQALRSYKAAVKAGQITDTPFLRKVWIESRASDPGSVEFARAYDEYLIAAFQDTSDFVGNIVKTIDEKFLAGVRGAQMYIAFANTLQRITSEIIKLTPPGAGAKVLANQVNPKVGRVQKAYDLARLPISFALFAGFMAWAWEEDEDGLPRNMIGTALTPEARRMMRAAGQNPMSFRIPGTETWVSMAGIAPLAPVAAMAADTVAMIKRKRRGERFLAESGPEGMAAASVQYMAGALGEHPFATGVSDLFRAIDTGEWDGLGYNFAATFMPNIVKRHLTEGDPKIPDARALGATVQERHDSHFRRFLYRVWPSGENAARQGLLPGVDYRGRENERPRVDDRGLNYILHMASPFQQVSRNADRIDLMLWSYNTMHPNDQWFPGEVPVVKTGRHRIDGTEIRMSLTERERYDIAKKQGEQFSRLMEMRFGDRKEPLTPRDVHTGGASVSKLWSRAGRIAELEVLQGRMRKLQFEIEGPEE